LRFFKSSSCRKSTSGLEAWIMGSEFCTLAYSEEVALAVEVLVFFFCSDVIVFLSDYSCSKERHTKRYSQTSKPWYERKESLKDCIPLLDGVIIPNAVRECKTIPGFFRKILRRFFICHIVSQRHKYLFVLK